MAAAAPFGAVAVLDYRADDLQLGGLALSSGRGADVVLDPVGAPYLDLHLRLLATGGRVVVIGLMGGRSAELDLAALMTKRATLHGSTLRARPWQEKAEVCAAVVEQVWPLVARGAVRPVVDRVLPLADAAGAHRVIEAGEHVGKVLLVP